MIFSFIKNLLNYSQDVKKTHLQSCLFFQDEADKFNDVTSKPFQERLKCFDENTVELCSHIHTELSNVDKLLLNHLGLRVKFYR